MYLLTLLKITIVYTPVFYTYISFTIILFFKIKELSNLNGMLYLAKL